jgi:hypothetical protein
MIDQGALSEQPRETLGKQQQQGGGSGKRQQGSPLR